MHQENKLSELVELMITLLKPDLATAEHGKTCRFPLLHGVMTSTHLLLSMRITFLPSVKPLAKKNTSISGMCFCRYIIWEFIKVD
jgi:hypothetical protein